MQRLRTAVAVIGSVVALLATAGAAQAAGTPDITASATSSRVLLGQDATVNLTAANPTGTDGYNLSFRVVLPEGVSYTGGPTVAGGSVTPTILHDVPAPGQTTLLFDNVSDLSPNSSFQFDSGFTVSHDPDVWTVGQPFPIQVEAYVNTDARVSPQFDANGDLVPGTATGTAGPVVGEQTIVALRVGKTEGSPEGEILRGVHDHQTTYTLTVTTNDVHSTDGVTVDDYLPAGLEFLGCGGAGADHTTDAPTNPGSTEEYPGSGPIVVPAVPGCIQPAAT